MYLSIYLSIYLSVGRSVGLSALSLSVYLSIYLSIHPSIHLSIYLSIHPSIIYLSTIIYPMYHSHHCHPAETHRFPGARFWSPGWSHRWLKRENHRNICQWEFQDPKMEVLYHITYFLGIFPYIGLIYGRYLQFRFLKWPLNMGGVPSMGNPPFMDGL